MNNIFGENGFVFRIVNKFADLFVLNLVYMISCLPIITIGAASTALYSLTLKMCNNQEGNIIKDYWNSFKNNIKKSTIIWCVFLLIFCLLGVDFWLVYSLINPGFVKKILQVVLCAGFLLAMMMFSYMFPQIAFFENSVSNYFKNSIIISMTRIGYTIIVVILNMLPLIIFMSDEEIFVMGLRFFIIIGWSLIAYLNSILLNKVFGKYK